MRKLIITAALASLAFASTADAKSWQWKALDVAGGKVAEIATGADCNYARAISQARKAGADAKAAAFTLEGIDDPAACPAKPKAKPVSLPVAPSALPASSAATAG